MFRFSRLVKKICYPLSAALCLTICACEREQPSVRHVFLFVGDGASHAQRRIAGLRAGGTTVTDGLPAQGVAIVSAVDSALPDNAAAAGAIATGKAVGNGRISMIDDDGADLPLITEIAAKNGYAVGVLTNGALDGAAVAPFYARAPKKQNYYDIAVQVKGSGFPLFVGQAFKRPKAFQKEDLDAVLKKGGYKRLTSLGASEKLPSGKVVAAPNKIPFALDAKPETANLSAFVAKAIEKFQDKDFFIVAVAGKIAEAAEAGDTETMAREIAELDKAVGTAVAFHNAHPTDTLIVVAGTVEAGGLILGAKGAENLDLSIFDRQTVSMDAFKSTIGRFRRRRQTGAMLEDFMPQIEKATGLRLLSKEQKSDLKEAAKNGDAEAATALKMNLEAGETARLREAFRYSMTDLTKRPKTDAFLDKYGKFEPLTIALARVLAARAGVTFELFGQTAAPMPVSAIGRGSESFAGVYPQTALFAKILRAMGLDENGERIIQP